MPVECRPEQELIELVAVYGGNSESWRPFVPKSAHANAVYVGDEGKWEKFGFRSSVGRRVEPGCMQPRRGVKDCSGGHGAKVFRAGGNRRHSPARTRAAATLGAGSSALGNNSGNGFLASSGSEIGRGPAQGGSDGPQPDTRCRRAEFSVSQSRAEHTGDNG